LKFAWFDIGSPLTKFSVKLDWKDSWKTGKAGIDGQQRVPFDDLVTILPAEDPLFHSEDIA